MVAIGFVVWLGGVLVDVCVYQCWPSGRRRDGLRLVFGDRIVDSAVHAGLPIFLVILIIPTAIVKGIYLVFESSWTLAYRDVAKGAGETAVHPCSS